MTTNILQTLRIKKKKNLPFKLTYSRKPEITATMYTIFYGFKRKSTKYFEADF